jgi:hypothetical protein
MLPRSIKSVDIAAVSGRLVEAAAQWSRPA